MKLAVSILEKTTSWKRLFMTFSFQIQIKCVSCMYRVQTDL